MMRYRMRYRICQESRCCAASHSWRSSPGHKAGFLSRFLFFVDFRQIRPEHLLPDKQQRPPLHSPVHLGFLVLVQFFQHPTRLIHGQTANRTEILKVGWIPRLNLICCSCSILKTSHSFCYGTKHKFRQGPQRWFSEFLNRLIRSVSRLGNLLFKKGY